ncbi:NAD-dependent deacetylase [Dethiosulfatibacter aminovorans DSM 17477]|uniref:NAD-dependent protein deacetylase n=2 Tax=Dethiosulfatibacter TaxID=448125 RepID=A0A1M6JHD9_9FIRM|nr:NAD-dependent deacetylase [Dethiosulfatibacter aminovorans DSM 17477]
MIMNKIGKLREIIKNSNYIVFFGGAGVSTESNIPDFRSEEGLYSAREVYNHSPEEMLSISFFNNHTETFYRYYREYILHPEAQPNDAHKTLAMLEKEGILKAVITQNIDGLHQKAGSREVLELHGSVERNYCSSCHKKFGLEYITDSIGVPKCNRCGKLVRPDVVLYGEGLETEVIDKSIHYIENADTLIVGGTSLVVYPAAGLIRYFKGKNLVLINKSGTPFDARADLVINESIGKVLKKAVENTFQTNL